MLDVSRVISGGEFESHRRWLVLHRLMLHNRKTALDGLLAWSGAHGTCIDWTMLDFFAPAGVIFVN